MNGIEELLELKARLDVAKEKCQDSLVEIVNDINSKIEILKLFGKIESEVDNTFTFDCFAVNKNGRVTYAERDD